MSGFLFGNAMRSVFASAAMLCLCWGCQSSGNFPTLDSNRSAWSMGGRAPIARNFERDAERRKIDRLITHYALREGVPVRLAKAVVRVESNYRPQARGRAGEVGLMQIKPATARGMGYRGSARGLYDPETNIRWGMRYLGQARRIARGDVCGTAYRYNAGLAARGNHRKSRYCGAIKRHM